MVYELSLQLSLQNTDSYCQAHFTDLHLQRREIRLALLLTDADLLLPTNSPVITIAVDRVKRLTRSSEDKCRRVRKYSTIYPKC